mgnify:CR=1 FL=1
MISRKEALDLMHSLVENVNLRKHMYAVAACLEDYAKELGQDADLWWITGILHDADYEKYPDKHPHEIMRMLQEKNAEVSGYAPEEMIHSIAGHGNGEGFSKRESLLDHYLFACDELSGFIVACSLVNPERLSGVKISSVTKRLKDKSFARGVNRDDVYEGIGPIGKTLEEHIAHCHASLLRIKDDLGL